MTEHPENTPPPSKEASAESAHGRGRAALFIVIFVVTVLALLTAYRYAIHSRLNDWYLFQVARHTSMALDFVGHSSQLEPILHRQPDPRLLRATMNAWKEGREAPTPEEIAAAPDHPADAWEVWSHRAMETRRSGINTMYGPRVFFVLRPGIFTEISRISAEIQQLEADTEVSSDEKLRRLGEARVQLESLRSRQQAIRRQENPPEEDLSRYFIFIVVPECGAIEVMAIFLAAVLAFPALWWKRLVGIAAGLPVMYGVNIFRLTVLAVIGAMDRSGEWFNFAHLYVWQAVYIIFVVAVWLLWVEYVVRRNRA